VRERVATIAAGLVLVGCGGGGGGSSTQTALANGHDATVHDLLANGVPRHAVREMDVNVDRRVTAAEWASWLQLSSPEVVRSIRAAWKSGDTRAEARLTMRFVRNWRRSKIYHGSIRPEDVLHEILGLPPPVVPQS
jgi:hypothetical protein